MPDYYTGYYDESRLRGGGNGSGYVPETTPINTQFTYTNGRNFAGTNTPMSDQAYEQLMRSLGAIPTSADVMGTGGVGNSLVKAGEFELDHVGNIFEGLADQPERLIFGFDPLVGQRASNYVSGRNEDPLVNQMGGATSQQIADYEAKHGLNSAGGAQGLHNAAAGTAGIVAAGTLANGGFGGGGQGNGLYTMTPAEQAQITSGLTNVPAGVGNSGVMGFGGAGTGGIPSQLSMGNAAEYGAAGNGLVLEGGAGTIGGSWLPKVMEYGPKVAGALNQGGGGGGGSAPMAMPQIGGMMGSQAPVMQPKRQAPQLNQSITRFRGYGRTPLQFRGTTVWL
jgi:hypothetical protein